MMQAQSRKPIELDGLHAALQAPLAMIEDEARRAELQRFLDAARVFQERAVFDLLADVTAAVNQSGAAGRVALEYEGGRLYLALQDAEAEYAEAPLPGQDGTLDKVTLRLPSQLKAALDQAASVEGISLNSWCLHALWRAASRHAHRHGAREEGAPAGPRGRGRRRRGREVD